MGLPLHLARIPPLWREGRMPLEAAGLVRDPVWRGAGVPRGEGRPVLLIPGFLAGDSSMAMMTHWLRELGYRTKRAGIRVNVDCSALECERLERRLEILAERFEQRVAIVGQSRGGTLARVLAVERPDLVSGVVSLGSPMGSQLTAVHPLVLAQIGVVAALGSIGRPGMFSHRCLLGACCARFREGMVAPFPSEVGLVCVYSRTDGVVRWRNCLDPQADAHVEIRASHCGMSVNAEAYRAVGDALARFGAAGAGAGGGSGAGASGWARAA